MRSCPRLIAMATAGGTSTPVEMVSLWAVLWKPGFGLQLRDVVTWTAVSSLIWWSIYVIADAVSKVFSSSYRKCSDADKVEWRERVMSTVHALFEVVAGVAVLVGMRKPMAMDPVYAHSLGTGVYMCIGLAYFLVDTLVMLANYDTHTFSWGGVFHHAASTVAEGYAVLSHVVAKYVVVFGLTELSTPFVNARFFLVACGLRDGLVYTVNGLLVWLGFTLCRLPAMAYLVHAVVIHWKALDEFSPVAPWVSCCMTAVVAGLNLVWWFKISKLVLSSVLPSRKAAESDSTPCAAGHMSSPNAADLSSSSGSDKSSTKAE